VHRAVILELCRMNSRRIRHFAASILSGLTGFNSPSTSPARNVLPLVHPATLNFQPP
jgi:hypothetical protein